MGMINEPLKGDRDPSAGQRPKEWIQKRYIVAIMGSVCVAMMMILKVNLSVGIVAMVKPLHTLPDSDDLNLDDAKEEGEFQWDMETQGHILAAYYYGYVATQFFGGYAANRWGGKMMVGPGIALTGLFTLFSPLAARNGGPWALFAVRVLEGTCSGVILPGMHHMFSVWFPREERSSFSAAIFSSLNWGTLIGMGASGLLSKWPLEGGGWPMVFYFFGAIGVAFIIPWWLLIYNDPESHPHISQEEKTYILRGRGNQRKINEVYEGSSVPWRNILTDIHVWAAIIFHWGIGWVLYTMLTDLPTYMKNVLHFDIGKLALLSAVPNLLSWISSISSGFLSQWLRKMNYLSHLTAYRIFNGIASLGSAAFLLAITQVGYNPDAIVVFLALNGLTSGAFFGGSYVNHMDLAVNYAGVISGILHTILNSCGIVIPLVISEIVKDEQTLEKWSIVFYMGAGVSAATYVIYLIFGSVEERPWNAIHRIKN